MSKTKEGTEDAEAGGCGGEYLDRPEVLESGELYGYLERYKKAFERLIELEGSQYAKRVEAGNAAENVWTEQSKTEVLSAECPRCLEPYKHSVKHTSANFSEYMHSELVRTLSDVEQINEDVTACTYDTYLKRSHLFYYVNNFFVHVQTLASALDSSSPVPACPLSAQSSEQRAEVQHLRHMLNVLFYHYRAPAPSIARSNLLSIDFNKDVADGIAGVGGVLLRAASYSDHLFLLRHCLACPALAPALVQLPPAAAWTPGTVRFYAKAVRTAADVVLSAESAHQGNNIGNSSRDMAFTLCSTADASGACFFPQEAPAMAAVVVSVSEEEVNNVFVQLDPRPLVDFLRKAISVGGPTAVLACSEDLEELLDALCSTLRPIALMKYLELGRTVTRALAVVLSFIASPIAVTAAAAPAVPDDNGDSAAVAAHCLCISQRVFDMSLIKTARCMLKLGKEDPAFLELFRDALPVEALSQEEGFWGYLAALHFVDAPEKDEQQGVEADSNGDDAERAPWSHEEWGQYPLRQAPGEMPLDSLARELSTTPGLRQCIPDALLRAALAFGEDAKLACLVALFQIGFVDVRTRGEMLGNSTMAICSICTASPAQISYLVRLFACSYTLVPASDCEGLSKGLSFVGWAPDPTLIREAQGWLLRDFGAAGSSSSSGGFHALGKLVLENAPWSAMSPTLNQYAGYLIIEVMETLRNPAASPFSFLAGATVATAPRKMRDDLMRWCWAMLLRFNYAVPTETKKKKKRIPAAASADGGNEGNVAESEGEVKDAVADENVEEEEEEEEEEFFVVKKNTSSFRVLVPENEDEKKYLREITVITDAATVHFHDIITGRVKKKGVDLLLAFAAFVLTECGSRWEEWTAAPYGALKVLEACSDEAVIFKVLRWACAAFAAGGTLYQLLSWQLRAFVEGLVTSEVTTMPRLLDGVVSPSIASDASSGRGYVHADFWIHLALETNGSGSSGNPSAAAATAHKRICEDAFCQDIIAGVLRAWFVRRSTEIPFPQFQAVAMSLAAEAGLPDDGTASLIPFDPLSPADPIPKSLSSSSSFSLFASMWSWLSHATTEHLLAVPFLVFEVLYIETRSILEAEKVLPQLLSGRMIQWLNYTLRLGQDCEIITLFTQASLYLYLRCLFDPENTKSKKSFAILFDWKGRIVQFLEKNVVLNDYFEYVAPAVKLLTKDMHTLEAFVCAVPYHKDYTRTFTLSPFATHENLLIRLLKISNGEGNNNSNDAAAAAAADGGGCDGGCVNTNAQAVKDVAALFKVCSPAAAAESYKPHYERGQIDVYGPGVGEQVDACVKALDAATARELQRINEIKMLNTAFLSDIRKLHSNTDTNSTHTIRCTKITTADKPCNGKIVLEYVQHTEETDATIGACIKENRRRYNDLLAPLKIPQEVFTWMFRVERVCRTICEEATRCTPEARARLAATAKSVFQKVLGVAAMHKVLWLVNYNFLAFLPSVTTVLASSPTDAQALVDYVLANRRYVPTVAKHFKPYNSVPIFPSVLTLVLSVYDGDTLTPLLGSCNISAWLRLHPTVEQKKTVIEVLCKQDETTLLTHKPVLQYSAVSLSTVLRSDFPSLVEDAIRVVAKARASVLAVEAWKVFDRALVAQIPLDQTHRILQLLRDLVLAARTASRPVYLPWVHPLCDFVYELVKVHAKASPNSEVPLTLEDETYAMYDTWLRVSPDLGGTPWSEKSARDQNVRALVSFFADTVVLFGSVTGGEAFSRVWGWLAPLLAKGTCAPSFVRDPVFHAFAGVSWKLWSPSAADVALAVDALQDPAVASPALAELLLRAANDVTWETLDFASTPSFLGKAALWAAAVVCRAPRAAEPAVEKMIQGWILPMDWAVTATDAEFHSALAAEWSTTLFPALRSHAQNKDELRMRGQKLLLLLMKACLVVGPGSTLAVEEEEEEEEENSAINDEDRKRARRKEDFARLEMFVKALTGIRGLTDDDNIGVYPDCAAAAFESYVRLAVKEQEPEDNNNDANDDNNVEPEIGNTESADEVTPAGTPVVDDVVDIPTVTADNDEEVESLKKNLRMLFSLYNCPQSKAIRSVVRGVLERHPDVVPEFLSVACETVSSVSILASAVNEMIDAYFYSSVVDSLPYAERSWDSVSAALRLSGKKAEFVGGCLTTGSLLALYAFHRMTRVNPSRTEKYEYQTWLLTMPLVAGKREHQLLLVTFGVLERAVTSISNVCSGDNGEEEKEGEEKEEKEKEDEEEAAVKKERFTKVVTKTAEILEKLGEDRSKEGFKGFFGRGEVSPFSAKLRLSTKVLAIFLSSQIVGGNSGSPNTVASVRTDSTTPLDKSVTVAAKKRVASLLDSLPKDKSYTAEMTPTAITTLLKKLDDMVSDSEVTVRSFGELFTEIVRNLYQEKLEFYPLLN